MNKIILINRFLLSIGIVLALVPIVFISLQGGPGWLSEAIYQSAAWILLSIVVMALLTELYYRFFKNIYLAIILLSATFAVVMPACLYVNGATFFGAKAAEFDTWHLLPLFTAFHQIKATILLTVAIGVICIVIACGKTLARHKAR